MLGHVPPHTASWTRLPAERAAQKAARCCGRGARAEDRLDPVTWPFRGWRWPLGPSSCRCPLELAGGLSLRPELAPSWSHRREQHAAYWRRVSPRPASPRDPGFPCGLFLGPVPQRWPPPRPSTVGPPAWLTIRLSPSAGEEAGLQMQRFPACVTRTQAWPPYPAHRTPSLPPPLCPGSSHRGWTASTEHPVPLRNSQSISITHQEPRDQAWCHLDIRPAVLCLAVHSAVRPANGDSAVSGCVWAAETSAQPRPSLPGLEGCPWLPPCGHPAGPPATSPLSASALRPLPLCSLPGPGPFVAAHPLSAGAQAGARAGGALVPVWIHRPSQTRAQAAAPRKDVSAS